MTYKDIMYHAQDGIVEITLNRPEKLNCFRSQTVRDLTHAITEADQDRTVGVIILTGTGKAFSVGGDIDELSQLNRETGRQWNQRLIELAMKMRGTAKPLIAAVNGFCIAGGNELNMFCDLTIASDRAVFGQAGPKIGGCPLWGGTQLLPRLVGDKRAREIIMLCLQYSAQEALAMGWINRVVPHEDLMLAAREWAHIILDRAPQSIALAKLSVNYESDALYASLAHGGALLEFVWGSEQFHEGVSAFKDKRPPNFHQFRH
ncbi:MAG: 1,4-dihydroxy-6-naphthoate synthase [Sulfobacillus acidophilus]|uniref:1,4-dihydroxy-6-naphthoate synthase n=1 Tax=Sulfobacillus acidophilus TaxID=53633 RepID=A0A2T2WNB3_9FIRM|nr:MAG: 1,4-dihydroxy-6-naphthoate synthase [Sulfobacillus acidophilus]